MVAGNLPCWTVAVAIFNLAGDVESRDHGVRKGVLFLAPKAGCLYEACSCTEQNRNVMILFMQKMTCTKCTKKKEKKKSCTYLQTNFEK